MHELLGKVAPSALKLRATRKERERSANPHIDRIINSNIHLPDVPDDDRRVLISESLHQAFWKNDKQRNLKLKNIYAELSEPEDLIVMICCHKFCYFLKLWLQSCDQHQISVRDKTIVFTLDEDADKQASAMGFKTYFLDSKTYLQAGNSVNFGDHNFRITMFYKNAAIYECLQLGANILFQDVDLIWQKDPIPYLKSNNQNSQIQIMYDGPNPRHFPYYANTGFIYIKQNDVNVAIFETALCNTTSIFLLDGHQPPLNRIFNHFAEHNLLNLTVLPESLFINGHLFNTVKGIKPTALDWETDAIVIHYSWTGNIEDKVSKLEKFNFFNVIK